MVKYFSTRVIIVCKIRERSLDLCMSSKVGSSEPTALRAEHTTLFKDFFSFEVRFPNHTAIELVRKLSVVH